MRGDEIQEHPYSLGMGSLDEGPKVRDRPIFRTDGEVLHHIIAVIRRGGIG